MVDQRRSPRQQDTGPITFRLGGTEAPGELVNLSGNGILFRFSASLPIGPEAVGQRVTLISWYDVGALIRPEGTVVRYFEDTEGKLLAVRYLPD
ncbi:MAG TPA: PilZ domain-containing protein [Spirochaetia bacterium]|jgi:hypothetical protein|nr:PilZ domain-containing protein [Spirochaetia bacterium]